MSASNQQRLVVDDLVVTYGQAAAIEHVSFDVQPGECVGVVGANGAGKSTLLRSIAGLLRPRSGTIRLDGHDVTREQPWSIARRGLRLVPEGRELFADLTVAENLRAGSAAVPSAARAKAIQSAVELFPALRELRTRRASVLSGGEQQMLVIARAMVGRPSILLLDEPSLGLAPAIVNVLLAALREIKRSGMSILVAEQGLKIPEMLCDRVLVCTLGRIVADGPPAEVLTESVLRQAFVGSSG